MCPSTGKECYMQTVCYGEQCMLQLSKQSQTGMPHTIGDPLQQQNAPTIVLPMSQQAKFFKFQGKVINTAFVISAAPNIIKDAELESYEILVKVYNGMDVPVTLWQGFSQKDDMNTEFAKLEKLLGL